MSIYKKDHGMVRHHERLCGHPAYSPEFQNYIQQSELAASSVNRLYFVAKDLYKDQNVTFPKMWKKTETRREKHDRNRRLSALFFEDLQPVLSTLNEPQIFGKERIYDKNWRDAAILVWVFATGGRRISEIEGVTFQDVRQLSDGSYIFELRELKNCEKLIVTLEKGGDLDTQKRYMWSIFERWVNYYVKWCDENGGFSSSCALFPIIRGVKGALHQSEKGLTRLGGMKLLEQYFPDVKQPNRSLRRGFAASGNDIVTTQLAMGHNHTTMTQRYQKLGVGWRQNSRYANAKPIEVVQTTSTETGNVLPFRAVKKNNNKVDKKVG